MKDRLVIISCGAGKREHAAAAAELYTGPYFRSCLAAARRMTTPDRIMILSARYGLLRLDDVAAPYDLTIGQPGAVSAVELAWQALELGEWDSPVTVLAPARYADLCRDVWRDVSAPLAHLGIGQQRARLAAIGATR